MTSSLDERVKDVALGAVPLKEIWLRFRYCRNGFLFVFRQSILCNRTSFTVDGGMVM